MRIIFACLIYIASLPCLGAPDIVVPSGYELQHLDPTDGEIAKPKGWYYTSSGTKSGWLWTLSAEDPKLGYETGMRIQMFIGVEEHTKHSREEFAANIFQQKRKSSKVLQECPANDQGDFMRQCMEVLETISRPDGDQQYHIVYSVFWGKKMDLAVVTTFGTPIENWENVKSISAAMEKFELIGPNFGKQNAKSDSP